MDLTLRISEELKCAICLDFLRRAMSVNCGHNFCKNCVLQLTGMTLENTFKCPVCRKPFQTDTVWPNQQLCTVVPLFKSLQPPLSSNLNQRQVMKTKFGDEINLDPEAAHPGLILSTDRKTVREKDSWKKLHCTVERSDLCGPILATRSFTSGRHYWEVTVGNSSAWDVGLCTNSAKFCHSTENISPFFSTGFWLLSLRKNKYIICTTPLMSIPLRGKLNKVGIFLDYEVGDIVFYDVDNSCQIYTVTGSFSEPLWPLFSIGLHSKDENVLTINPISDEVPETPDTSLETSSKGKPSH